MTGETTRRGHVVLGSIVVLAAATCGQILLDAETPATGSNLLIQPLVTPYGTVTFAGEFFSPPSDPDFIAVGAAGTVFDVVGNPSTAQFTFSFDVSSITFIYGGNGGSILLEARNVGGSVVDSYFQADTGNGQPAGPRTLSGAGIRSLWWTDASGNYAALDNVVVETGVTCTLTGPAGVATGDISLALDTTSVNSPTVDVSFEYSLDSGNTWNPCTAAVASPLPNPANGIPTGPATFLWDSVADAVGMAAVATGVLLQATVSDGVAPNPAVCQTAPFDVDNLPPPPTCTLTGPVGVAGWDITLDLDSATPNAGAVDVTFEYSIDGGATWSACTPAAASPLGNPAAGQPVGPAVFVWDSHGDAVGLVSVQAGVQARATVDDGVSPVTGDCTTAPFDVDNTALCGGLCGDCNSDAAGPNILDGLVAAQIAAALVIPTPIQEGCCDVNASLSVDIIDALLMAQAAAQLPVAVVCP